MTDEEYRAYKRTLLWQGIIGTIVLVILQALLCVWLGVEPHVGPM